MKNTLRIMAVCATAMFFSGEVSAATTWNVSVWGKRRAFTEHIHKLAELVEQRSNGDMKLNISYGGLSKPRENLDGISVGAFEMAQTCIFYHPSKVPAYSAIDMPFIGITSIRHQGAYEFAMHQHPALRADMARWNAMTIMPTPLGQYNLVGVGSPPGDPANLNGMRIRMSGPIGDALAKLGGVPTSLTAGEAYNALSTGVVDAVAFAEHAHLAFKTGEVGQWWTENLSPGAANCPVIVNIDAYNGLGVRERGILDDAIGDAMEHYYTEYEKVIKKWNDFVDEKGITRVRLSDADVRRVKEKVRPVHEEWIKANAGSIPAQGIYDAVIAAARQTAPR